MASPLVLPPCCLFIFDLRRQCFREECHHHGLWKNILFFCFSSFLNRQILLCHSPNGDGHCLRRWDELTDSQQESEPASYFSFCYWFYLPKPTVIENFPLGTRHVGKDLGEYICVFPHVSVRGKKNSSIYAFTSLAFVHEPWWIHLNLPSCMRPYTPVTLGIIFENMQQW